jgi:hypothetical protein
LHRFEHNSQEWIAGAAAKHGAVFMGKQCPKLCSCRANVTYRQRRVVERHGNALGPIATSQVDGQLFDLNPIVTGGKGNGSSDLRVASFQGHGGSSNMHGSNADGGQVQLVRPSAGSIDVGARHCGLNQKQL